MKNKSLYILLVTLLHALSACEKKNELNVFYDKIDNTFSITSRIKILECPNFDCIKMELWYNKEINLQIPTSIIDSLLKYGVCNQGDQAALSLYAYKCFKAKKEIAWQAIVAEYQKKESVNNSLMNAQWEKDRRIIENYSLYLFNMVKNGSTIKCTLPLDTIGSRRFVAFRSHANPEAASEKLSIRCRIIGKVKDTLSYHNFHGYEYFLKLKVLDTIDRQDLSESDELMYKKKKIFYLPLDISYPFPPFDTTLIDNKQ